MKTIALNKMKLVKIVVFSTAILGSFYVIYLPVLANSNINDQLNFHNTLVHQLDDISLTDWEMKALQKLVENYEVTDEEIINIFQTNSSLTRAEFAIILNTTLNYIYESLENNYINTISQDDIATIEQLINEFATEFAILRGRIDGLQARTTEQELTQFSTTTKLTGIATFNISGVAFNDTINAEGINEIQAFRDNNNNPIVRRINQENITLSQKVELSLNTSLTGDDLLLTT